MALIRSDDGEEEPGRQCNIRGRGGSGGGGGISGSKVATGSDSGKVAKKEKTNANARLEADAKNAGGKNANRRRDTPAGTPSGVRRALGFSNSTTSEKGSKSSWNSSLKAGSSPKTKPWK